MDVETPQNAMLSPSALMAAKKNAKVVDSSTEPVPEDDMVKKTIEVLVEKVPVEEEPVLEEEEDIAPTEEEEILALEKKLAALKREKEMARLEAELNKLRADHEAEGYSKSISRAAFAGDTGSITSAQNDAAREMHGVTEAESKEEQGVSFTSYLFGAFMQKEDGDEAVEPTDTVEEGNEAETPNEEAEEAEVTGGEDVVKAKSEDAGAPAEAVSNFLCFAGDDAVADTTEMKEIKDGEDAADKETKEGEEDTEKAEEEKEKADEEVSSNFLCYAAGDPADDEKKAEEMAEIAAEPPVPEVPAPEAVFLNALAYDLETMVNGNDAEGNPQQFKVETQPEIAPELEYLAALKKDIDEFLVKKVEEQAQPTIDQVAVEVVEDKVSRAFSPEVTYLSELSDDIRRHFLKKMGPEVGFVAYSIMGSPSEEERIYRLEQMEKLKQDQERRSANLPPIEEPAVEEDKDVMFSNEEEAASPEAVAVGQMFSFLIPEPQPRTEIVEEHEKETPSEEKPEEQTEETTEKETPLEEKPEEQTEETTEENEVNEQQTEDVVEEPKAEEPALEKIPAPEEESAEQAEEPVSEEQQPKAEQKPTIVFAEQSIQMIDEKKESSDDDIESVASSDSDAARDKAFMNALVSKDEGDSPGQYTQDDVDAILAAVSSAKSEVTDETIKSEDEDAGDTILIA
eukprot:CAMPEP_0172446020 /NCGR_PEP_ID=MMETSP1065-20121228/5726_1 /TAXON_ID=265537 /ORGANISM="Amphiprora paludosa, Strain CCMP125" /LENGTH=682 /DNA_ID=CAMNT_0013197037 /DNA_START=27 /DNA_END=2075 /DNA_ORIENTATION=-